MTHLLAHLVVTENVALTSFPSLISRMHSFIVLVYLLVLTGFRSFGCYSPIRTKINSVRLV